MHVETYSLPHAWYRRTAAYLARLEAENNLMLGLAYILMHDPGAFSEYYLGTVVEDEQVVGAAVMTVPYNLVLSHTEHPDALDALAANVYRTFRTLPGVNGRKENAAAFARIWSERTGHRHELEMAQRIYELREVRPPEGVPGTLRTAVPSDIDMMAEWQYAFAIDAHMEADRERSRIWAERVFQATSRRIYFWMVDGQAVCMVGTTGPTPRGIRIGPVYTPAEQRRKGYGSACTAAVSQAMLDEGKAACFLYTDLANPTSNKIYQEIGYTPVCDADIIRFYPRV
ncbi:MAG: GNAT family N-acetyltransferase [Chloroflexi bacterium]|nr:GNAT family N-acetyltransferase [Chloroflexota bacterium]